MALEKVSQFVQQMNNLFSFSLEFADQLANYSTAYEHQQYIGLLEKLQQFVKK